MPVILLAYLGVAMLWAWFAIDLLANTTVVAPPLSPRQQVIVLQIEDPTFLAHHGLSSADGQGLTTVSSALVRDMLVTRDGLTGIQGLFQDVYRGVFNCCKRIDIGRDVMALAVDARLPKAVQLQLYATNVYMGTMQGVQVRGLHRASQAYFGKPLDQLPEADFIGLVGMIKAPNEFHPVAHPEAYALRRRNVASVVSGACQAHGWFDTSYEHCQPK